MFIFNFFGNAYSEAPRKIKNGDKYTSEWWREKANLSHKAIAAARLCRLEREGVVEKIDNGVNEIVCFTPANDKTVVEIISMIKDKS